MRPLTSRAPNPDPPNLKSTDTEPSADMQIASIILFSPSALCLEFCKLSFYQNYNFSYPGSFLLSIPISLSRFDGLTGRDHSSFWTPESFMFLRFFQFQSTGLIQATIHVPSCSLNYNWAQLIWGCPGRDRSYLFVTMRSHDHCLRNTCFQF